MGGKEFKNNYWYFMKYLFIEVNRFIIYLYLFCYRWDLKVFKSKIKICLWLFLIRYFYREKKS